MKFEVLNTRREAAFELLKKTKIEVAPETYSLISLKHEDWKRLLENPELSPRGDAPFLLLQDKYEVTLLLDQIDLNTVSHAIRDAKIERGWRLVTFDLTLDWNVVGYFALIAEILAAAEIPFAALSAFSRDHLLIKQDDLANALKVLGEYVAELC
jgi:hypothetical protein